MHGKPGDRRPRPPGPGNSGRPSRPRRTDTPTDWGGVAEWYDRLVGESGSDYQREVILPGVERLLGLAAGERFLDVACGQGVLCRLLREKGIDATGVDAAPELIRLARSRSDRAIRYLVADARRLNEVPDLALGSFAAAACVLAVQNINPLPPVFAGVARCLAPSGRLVLAMMHPCFRGPKATSWGWDEEKGIEYRRVDRYLVPRKEPIVTHPGKDPTRYTWTFHRPLQAYVRALAAAGLLVDALEEWTSHKRSTSGPRAAAENRAREEVPMFLALRAVKVAAPGRSVPESD